MILIGRQKRVFWNFGITGSGFEIGDPLNSDVEFAGELGGPMTTKNLPEQLHHLFAKKVLECIGASSNYQDFEFVLTTSLALDPDFSKLDSTVINNIVQDSASNFGSLFDLTKAEHVQKQKDSLARNVMSFDSTQIEDSKEDLELPANPQEQNLGQKFRNTLEWLRTDPVNTRNNNAKRIQNAKSIISKSGIGRLFGDLRSKAKNVWKNATNWNDSEIFRFWNWTSGFRDFKNSSTLNLAKKSYLTAKEANLKMVCSVGAVALVIPTLWSVDSLIRVSDPNGTPNVVHTNPFDQLTNHESVQSLDSNKAIMSSLRTRIFGNINGLYTVSRLSEVGTSQEIRDAKLMAVIDQVLGGFDIEKYTQELQGRNVDKEVSEAKINETVAEKMIELAKVETEANVKIRAELQSKITKNRILHKSMYLEYEVLLVARSRAADDNEASRISGLIEQTFGAIQDIELENNKLDELLQSTPSGVVNIDGQNGSKAQALNYPNLLTDVQIDQLMVVLGDKVVQRIFGAVNSGTDLFPKKAQSKAVPFVRAINSLVRDFEWLSLVNPDYNRETKPGESVVAIDTFYPSRIEVMNKKDISKFFSKIGLDLRAINHSALIDFLTKKGDILYSGENVLVNTRSLSDITKMLQIGELNSAVVFFDSSLSNPQSTPIVRDTRRYANSNPLSAPWSVQV